jgi:hypothetical protein
MLAQQAMSFEAMSEEEARRSLAPVIGQPFDLDHSGKYWFVHLDSPRERTRRKRVDGFVPTLFFDPACPCCQPFLRDGAIIVCTGTEMVGMRLLPGGLFEAVVLRGDKGH